MLTILVFPSYVREILRIQRHVLFDDLIVIL